MLKTKHNTVCSPCTNSIYFFGFVLFTALSLFFTFMYFDKDIPDTYSTAWVLHVGGGMGLELLKNCGYGAFIYFIFSRHFFLAAVCLIAGMIGTNTSLQATKSFIQSTKSDTFAIAMKKAKLESPTFQTKLKQLKASQARVQGFTRLSNKDNKSKYHIRLDKARGDLKASGNETKIQNAILVEIQTWETRFKARYKEDHNSFYGNLAKNLTLGKYSDNATGQVIWGGIIEAGGIIFLWLFLVGIRQKTDLTLLMKASGFVRDQRNKKPDFVPTDEPNFVPEIPEKGNKIVKMEDKKRLKYQKRKILQIIHLINNPRTKGRQKKDEIILIVKYKTRTIPRTTIRTMWAVTQGQKT